MAAEEQGRTPSQKKIKSQHPSILILSKLQAERIDGARSSTELYVPSLACKRDPAMLDDQTAKRAPHGGVVRVYLVRSRRVAARPPDR